MMVRTSEKIVEKRILWLLLATLFLSGCSPSPFVRMNEPTKVAHSTNGGDAVSNVHETGVSSISPTGFPKVQPEDYDAFITNLLLTNRGCELPCWWGAIPGKSEWKHEEEFLSSFAREIGYGGSGTKRKGDKEVFFENTGAYFPIPGYSSDGVAEYHVADGIIQNISVADRGTDMRYRIGQLLALIGPPDGIFIYIQVPTPDHVIQYDLMLIYANKGIRVLYEWVREYSPSEYRGEEGMINVCPRKTGPSLTLFPPNAMTMDEIMQYGWDSSFPNAFRTLEAATGLTNNELFLKLKEDKDTCIQSTYSQ